MCTGLDTDYLDEERGGGEVTFTSNSSSSSSFLTNLFADPMSFQAGRQAARSRIDISSAEH